MDHTARIPVAVGGGLAAQPWRHRIRRIAAVPVLAAAVLVAVAAAADWVLDGSAAFRGWLFTPWAALVAVAVVLHGHRLVRRACTAVSAPLPGLLRHGTCPEALDAARAREEQDLENLRAALRVRMFAMIDLYPREAADELVARLRRALDRPEPLSAELRAVLDDLDDGARRWHDTLA
ncbi:hypothetical protein [Streptomyces botrytidirepellens]|uniref:Uncharacterized protein n=1 Tax=Streptomyces botrytidirepellens TaxID=2486417 RepID=A0A3M8X955_9ACTN|nr:hypothetical protein [Streptomyces botrytidirepellens]RNG37999.1 hypothetical protein EEJ42_02120 [Streptomyces botrytidirepellens]